MNSDGSPAPAIAPTLDLQALLATMPDFSTLPSLSTMPKDGANTEIPTSQQSLLFPSIPHDQLAALSLGLFPLQGFPMFPLLPMTPMTSSLPPHSTIESLGLMTNSALRPKTSSVIGPPVLDSRPRAFSSAAALQRPKPTTTPEKRRKRSRRAQEEEQSSVLRMLVDEEDDAPLTIRQPPSTKDLDEKLRKDAAKVLSASSPPPPAAKRTSPERLADLIEEPAIALRRIIRDEDLPDSIGPDSPFRHHPKYQRKQPDSEIMDGMDALMAFSGMSGYVAESEPTPSPKNDSGYTSAGSPKKSFAEMMEHAICRELVTAE
ncbi:unnamed protein product [Haemonchus placei]|uniref:Myb_Cef domain-containing protein n=1 Tax=Haemonchus placei TaxID=6290 RepID=A0A0N4WNV2_HAEPC|nr:unnamed protein product [Haemonchus placei]